VPTEPRSTWIAVAGVALAAAAARAVAFAPTELYADEAYYWLWSLRPAAGYYDHPPLVAWLIALSAPVVPGEVGVRLLFLAAGALTVVFAALLARELSPDARAPLYAAVLAASAPMLNLVGALALPDAPLAAAYTAALWLLARAHGRRWIAAGVVVGVALLAKYTAALLAPALLGLVVWDGELRRELRTPWPWLGAAVAVAMFAPCLAWNAQHGWISLRFQLGHGFASNATARSVAEYAAGQLLGAGPVALVVAVPALARAKGSAARRVAAAALLPLAVTTYAALRGRVEANWPALAYPALSAAAGAVLARPAAARTGRALVAASAALAALLLAAFSLEQMRPHYLAGTPAVERFHGWRDLAAAAREMALRACADAGCDPRRPFLFTGSYQYAAELAFYGGFRTLGPAVDRPSQLDVWDARPPLGGPFLFAGSDGPSEAFRRDYAAVGEGPTEREVVRYGGLPVRAITVTPFSVYAGDRGDR
jgi:4-amino-4-deoxy-L-arabinose transferase-like glycosyltransferase